MWDSVEQITHLRSCTKGSNVGFNPGIQEPARREIYSGSNGKSRARRQNSPMQKVQESKGQKKSFYRKVLRIIDDATNLVNTKASRMKKRAGFFKVMVVLPNCVCR